MIQDIRQSILFTKYMRLLGWETEKIDSNYIYKRKFPLIGYFAKMPRPNMPIDLDKIKVYKQSNKIFRLKISPLVDQSDQKYQQYQKKFIRSGFKIDHDTFNPTTNYLVDLTPEENEIFNNFSEAKRRAVRRAIKNGVFIKESNDLDSFIKIRQRQYLPVWFLVGGEMKSLWKIFYPQNASILLAYHPKNMNAIAGILLLFYKKQAYYWFASALSSGKKLFAPTLLVWEALKLSKKRGCTIFDFEGIYDERFPKASASWKGFTKFKEGFGVRKIIYLENFYL
ncbi:peptidoglycan bridge formation glycyltransferase FemA/FemB family protein [Candidatus Gottesmanbacteria bacterium]|nr:peptidoglycan bridge formation glycyltransferase FemA/FemB family protein [Candidatus Gottesmanbacteria bacterium]